jgi:DNA-3-methyladenine glycosylase II
MAVRCLTVDAPAPFRLDLTAWVLRRRPHNAIDRWDGETYRRTLAWGAGALEVAVRQSRGADDPALAVELRGAPSDLDDGAVARVRLLLTRMLGLDVDMSGFYRLAAGEAPLRSLASRFRGMRPPRFPTVFEALVNAIACQQLSLAVGIHLLNRLAQSHGPTVRNGDAASPAFPTAEGLAGADPDGLRHMGFSRAKARTITRLAQRVAGGGVDLEALRTAGDDEALAILLDLSGIGRWSAEYTLLRGLGRWHVLPGDDAGARRGLVRLLGLASPPDYAAMTALGRAWRPYGGIVYFHLLLNALASAGHVVPGGEG